MSQTCFVFSLIRSLNLQNNDGNFERRPCCLKRKLTNNEFQKVYRDNVNFVYESLQSIDQCTICYNLTFLQSSVRVQLYACMEFKKKCAILIESICKLFCRGT